MFSTAFVKTVKNVKALKVQGAENVVASSLDALSNEMQRFKAHSRSDFASHLRDAVMQLKQTRPTEPALRNSLRFVLSNALKEKNATPQKLKSVIAGLAGNYLQKSTESKEKIAAYGANLVPRKGVVLTICHSGTVMRALKKAFLKKKFEVTCLETRPLFQGRASAKELSSYGIPTTLMVDSSVSHAMREADVVFVGADAITASGDLVNKVGTDMVARVARDYEVPLYSLTGLHKFDLVTMWGEAEPIEHRDESEVLDDKARKQLKMTSHHLTVKNPAFDLVDHKLVEAYVTEYGVVPPQGLRELAEKYLA